MNRRRFIQSVAAIFALPALPALPSLAMPSVTAAVAVPAKAQSWAVYMSSLHGECTPQTLQSILNISSSEAKNYVTKLIADGIIKPNPILNSHIKNVVNEKKETLLDKFKKRLEMKSQAKLDEIDKNLMPEAETEDCSVAEQNVLLDGNVAAVKSAENNADEITPPPLI